MSTKTTLYSLLPALFIGILIWFTGESWGLSVQTSHLFAVFITVIICLITKPFPIGQTVMTALVFLAISNTVPIKTILLGFGNSTVWLVVAAFLIAEAVSNTGLGKRIALNMVAVFGKTTLGLAYSICISELILGPVVPSNTARGGGILAPVVNSLAKASSEASNDSKIAAYLTLIGNHANLITAAMFLTGMAANPLVSAAAKDIFNLEFGWTEWALGAIVPGILGLALLPHYLSKILKLSNTRTASAHNKAKNDLKQLGRITRSEKIVLVNLILLLVLWSTKSIHGMSTALVAWLGVCILLLTQAQNWDKVISNKRAWDTLIWLGGLLTMANLLKTYGFVDWFIELTQGYVGAFNGVTLVVLLVLIYFYSMYSFSMLTAHITALGSAFLVLMYAGKCPPLLAVAAIGYFSNLCACLTNYSSGPVIIYYGLGHVKSAKWFSTGFLVSIFHLVIWLGVGGVWWKVLGWW